MTWVAEQLWIWLVVSGVLGAAVTTWFSLGTTRRERWVTVPQDATLARDEEPLQVDAPDVAERLMAATHTAVPVGASAGRRAPTLWDEDTPLPEHPYPPYRGPGEDERPWENEELWSRPVRRAARVAAVAADEWDLAAESWRTWAEDAAVADPAPDETPPEASVEVPPVRPALPQVATAVEEWPTASPEPWPVGESVDEPASPAGPGHEEHVPIGLPAGGFGPGCVPALPHGSAPPGCTVKGILETRTYHTLDSRYYSRVTADVWFNSEAAAVEAGYTRWDRRDLGAELVRGELAHLRTGASDSA